MNVVVCTHTCVGVANSNDVSDIHNVNVSHLAKSFLTTEQREQLDLHHVIVSRGLTASLNANITTTSDTLLGEEKAEVVDPHDFISCWTEDVKQANPNWDEVKVYDQAILHCRDTAKHFYKSVDTSEGYKSWVQRGREALTSKKVRSAFVASNLFLSQSSKPRPCPSSYKDNEVLFWNASESPLDHREAAQHDNRPSPLDEFVKCWGHHTHDNCTGTELDRYDDAVSSCEGAARHFYAWAGTPRGFKKLAALSRHNLAVSLFRYFGPGAESDELCTSSISAAAALDLFPQVKDRSWLCQRPAPGHHAAAAEKPVRCPVGGCPNGKRKRFAGITEAVTLCDPREKRSPERHWKVCARRPSLWWLVALTVATVFGTAAVMVLRWWRGEPANGRPQKMGRRRRKGRKGRKNGPLLG